MSTGPGRHDFEIVADPSLSIEEDMRRRDFTVNAMARRLEDGTIVDPLDGRTDVERRVLRTVSPQRASPRIRRLVRGLRFVSQLGFELDEQTRTLMVEEAPAVRLVSGERIGGGLAADGMGELSKLLLGAQPAAALTAARDTGVLVELIPEFGPARYLADHIFAVVQETADAGDDLAVRGWQRSSTTSASRSTPIRSATRASARRSRARPPQAALSRTSDTPGRRDRA